MTLNKKSIEYSNTKYDVMKTQYKCITKHV